MIGFTDNTPEYAAGPESPGTARIEIDVDNEETRARVADALHRTRSHEPDLVIASLHWGPNMRTEPPDEFRVFARDLIDRGVDVVHGHSAHVFQGIELYDGRPIVYDAGDFVDDYAVDGELWNDRSFLFNCRIEGGTITELRLLPTEIVDCSVRIASEDAADWSRARMRELSEQFGTTFEREDRELVVDVG